ncbi:hypothetical protein A2533_01490 [Candidatus Falkowbacteria bacterium RIFOXYD2_FULL_35_9]|nr:MAG: hypothetical protein A2300_03750 [Candidatus Falkowbacteria bacterium RIFOXYB2_FULL_35_7]OGF45890.1 MAG: hypothetical protein A2533_01490 [Candidatus Falkowbacteria bacterium RIFOXYD2_FULL_35_9]
MVVVGFFFSWKTQWPMNMIGYVAFAERWFMGGSRTFYKLLGIILIFIGIIVITNLQDRFIAATLGNILF